MTSVAVVYHSGSGHTAALARAVARGASALPGVEAVVMAVDAVDWRALADADAIVFGAPTYMGSVSAGFKAFMDDSSARAWATRRWRDKIAAGFTCSSAASGDKLATLLQLAVFAAQHDMIWVGLGLVPGQSTRASPPDAPNRLGSHLGAMAWCPADVPADEMTAGDLETAARLGERVARTAARFAGAPIASAPSGRHPTTASWRFPDPARAPLPTPVSRTNLRELAARPDRFEHHLTVVARVAEAQLEVVTASEPLFFAHQNVSDEYALAMSTGDPLLEPLRFLTLLSDAASGADVGRIRHGVGDLVLHPHGLLHWPGRLRPPHEPFEFGPGARRAGCSIVLCATRPLAPARDRPLRVSADREADVKAYGDTRVPFLLVDTRADDEGDVAVIGGARLSLLVEPELVAPPRGGYVVVLEARDPSGALFDGDLVHVPEGATLDAAGVRRALLLSCRDASPEAPPPSWREVPPPPFAPFEDAAPARLPVRVGELEISDAGPSTVRVRLGAASAEVPRYWLARMLFRVALHGYRIGYLETYGGLFYDDRDGHRLGLRGAGSVVVPERALGPTIEHLYRAVAPSGYVERLT